MKITTLIAGISIALFSSSYALADNVPCPSVDVVKKTGPLLDFAQEDQDNPGQYVALTQNPVLKDADKYWSVGTAPIEATDVQDALTKGQMNVENAGASEFDTAQEFGPFLVCVYTAPIGTVMALTAKDPGMLASIQNFKATIARYKK